AGHRGVPGGAGRGLLRGRVPQGRARLLRARGRLGKAGEGPLPRSVVREPAGAPRAVRRRLHRRPDPEPGDAGPDPGRHRPMNEASAGPELRPTDEMSAEERRRLIEAMRPEDAEPVPELHEVDVPDELRERIETAMSKYPEVRSAAIPAL